MQGIEPLLENLFSFLRRKSDFFSGADPNKIEGTVLDILRKHKAIAEKDAAEKRKAIEKENKLKQERLEKKRKEEEAKKAAELAAAKSKAAPVAVGEEDVLELSEDGSFDTAASKAKANKVVDSTPSNDAADVPPSPPTAAESKNAAAATGDGNDSDKEEEDKSPPRKCYEIESSYPS